MLEVKLGAIHRRENTAGARETEMSKWDEEHTEIRLLRGMYTVSAFIKWKKKNRGKIRGYTQQRILKSSG